ncbi:tyrosine-type recombinase/integrase [Marinobacter salexigens]|uniref:phage integrase n=1 Tax=Marinobacter salexigens TaxID=1925763 RepID=UPI000C288104|nr:tyrosine-type recombinase/integrase [Marinobacter salexigens]
MIKKLRTGRWHVDIQPGGRGRKRVRKTFDSKAEALRFERLLMSQHTDPELSSFLTKDKRHLSQLVQVWFQSHGKFLRDGDRRYRHLLRMADALSDPVAQKLKARDFTVYRALRIQNGISPKTCNNELGYINAVFNELVRTKDIHYENPFSSIRPIAVPEREMGYLDHHQVKKIFGELQERSQNPHVYLVARISLETGARWSEAESLILDRVKPYRVTFHLTKSGRNRTVPVSQSLYTAIVYHLEEWGSFGTSTISAFRRAVERSGVQLPQGQCAHILRHTFASHFIMGGGHLLTLQKILGHSTINMTMRYSHLAPDHLEDAVRLNPFAAVDVPLTLTQKTPS